jgi:hypothetical protein
VGLLNSQGGDEMLDFFHDLFSDVMIGAAVSKLDLFLVAGFFFCIWVAFNLGKANRG